MIHFLRKDLTSRKRAQIVALSHAKKSMREIGKELGIPKSTVGRIVKRSKDNGGEMRQKKKKDFLRWPNDHEKHC